MRRARLRRPRTVRAGRAAPPKHEHKVGKHSSAEGELQRCFTVAPKEAASQPGSNESNYSAEREAASKLSLYGSYCDEAEWFARTPVPEMTLMAASA